jgi:hypothetical protein
MPHPKSRPARNAEQNAAADALNEEFQVLLRDGAQAREDRARAAAAQDYQAAAQESSDLIALARRPRRA